MPKRDRGNYYGGVFGAPDTSATMPGRLVKELGIETKNKKRKFGPRKRTKGKLSRKETRKQTRLQKKRKKVEHQAKKKQNKGQQNQSTKMKNKKKAKESVKSTRLPVEGVSSKGGKSKKRKVKLQAPEDLEELALPVNKRAKKMDRFELPKEDGDDKIIAKYEKKLGLADKSKYWKSKSFVDDGLDVFHDILENLGGSDESDGDRPEDIGGSESAENSDNDAEVDSSSESEQISSIAELQTTNVSTDEAKHLRRAKRVAIYGSSVVHSDDEDEKAESDPPLKVSPEIRNSIEEPTQSSGSTSKSIPSISGNYVPPHLRKQQTADEFANDRLKKLVRRHINKLTEANIETVAIECKQIYGNHARHDTTMAISECIINICCLSKNMLDSMAIAFAALITSLHIQVDIQIGSRFLETTLKRMISERQEFNAKSASNLLLVITNLFNFKMIHSGLMYDIIKMLCNDFTALDIELLVIVLRHCGYHLRKDDPRSLKEIILLIHSKENKVTPSRYEQEGGSTVRVEFMIELVSDLKNNKRRYAEQHEMLIPMKKWVNQINARQVDTSIDKELRVGLDDFLNAETKGRWWIVGSAWKGNNMDPLKKTEKKTSPLDKMEFSDDLVDLAKQLHMNTDIRKAIFCVIMGAQDFSDAFEKLERLNLRGRQDREVVGIIMLCSGREKAYNPYYSHLAQKLCSFYHSYSFTFQLALWDFMKEFPSLLDNNSDESEATINRRISNLGRLASHLIFKGGLSLTMLKSIDWISLHQNMILFLFVLFTELFKSIKSCQERNQHQKLEEIFVKLVQNKKIEKQLKLGISLFLQTHVLNHCRRKKNKDFCKFIRVAVSTLQLN